MRHYLRDYRIILITLVVASLVWLGVFPITMLVLKAFQVGDRFGLDNFVLMYSNPANVEALLMTVKVSLFTMAASLAVSVPLAWLVARSDLPGRHLLRMLMVSPYLVPPYVGAIAWTYLANPRVGYINRMLADWFGMGLGSVNIYGVKGLVWVLAIFYFPLSFLVVAHALQQMDPTLEEASRISGSNQWQTFRDVTFRLVAPSIIGGGLLVVLTVAATFGVPAIIGVPAGIEVVTTRIVRYVYIGTQDALRQSFALAVALMAIAMVILALSNYYLSRRQYAMVTGRAGRPELVALGRWKWPVVLLVFGAMFIFVVLPLGSLVLTTFVRSMGEPIGWGNWTLKHWQGMLAQQKTWNTLRVSVLLAVVTASLGLVMGYAIAYLKVRTRYPVRNVPDYLVTFSYATPGIVVALGMIIAFSGGFGPNLYGTVAILVLAYLARMLAYPVRTLSAALEQIYPSLEEAAVSCGANWWRATRDITIPLLIPALYGSWFLVFIRALYELTMSVLLYSAYTMTAGVYLYDLETYADPQSAAVISSLFLVLVLGGSLLMRWSTKGKITV